MEKGKIRFLENLFMVQRGEDSVPNLNNFDECFDYMLSTDFLSQEEKTVLEEYYRQDKSLQEVAEVVGKAENITWHINHSAMTRIARRFYSLFKYGDLELARYLKDSGSDTKKETSLNVSVLQHNITEMLVNTENLLSKDFPEETQSLLTSIETDLKKLLNKCNFLDYARVDLDSELIERIGLPNRVCNILKQAGYNYVKDFVGKTSSDFLNIVGFGKCSLAELCVKLQDYGVVINNRG